TPQHRTLDLNTLTEQGVRLAGRLAGVRDGRALFSGSLRHVCDLADLKMNRLLDRIDQLIDANGYVSATQPKIRFEPTRTPQQNCLGLDLGNGEIRSVVWATGMHPDWRWLDAPVFDRRGNLQHDGGVVDAPGLYAL